MPLTAWDEEIKKRKVETKQLRPYLATTHCRSRRCASSRPRDFQEQDAPVPGGFIRLISGSRAAGDVPA